jgi:hypothetical protein
MKDAATQSSSTGQYPWSIDEHSSTMVYVKNATADPQNYTMYVLFDGGRYALGFKTIEAGQTVAIDVREVRDAQRPDASGTTIPPDATRGQVHWSMHGNKELVLIGRSEQFDPVTGKSTTAACGLCCPDSFSSSWLTPDSVVGLTGQTSQFTSFRQDTNCDGTLLPPYTVNFNTWGSDNTSVATVNNTGFARAVGVGATVISMGAYANVYTYNGTPDEEHCDSDLVDASCAANCDVTPPPPCAVPVNLKQQGSGDDIGSGYLLFIYSYGSSTTHLSDLANCTIGEYVSYPGVGDFNWPSPPYATNSNPNPVIRDFSATSGVFQDQQRNPGFLRPYLINQFTAVQYYRYQCPCANGGNYVNMSRPIDITRNVNSIFGSWRYWVTKSGSSAQLNLP